VVVDTMVLAFALIGEAELHHRAVEALAAADDLWAPESINAELVNVLWLWVRHRGVEPAAAVEVLRDVEALLTGFVPIRQLWEQALALSIDHGHSPYDTLFVALAIERGTTVLTDDRDLLERFPAHTTALT
jgi:predicted nucleic acid-binding protein